MQLRIKTTGFSLTPLLEERTREKILKPLERRVGKELPEDLPLDVELAKITKHHSEGKIWKCEVNLPLPGEKRTLYCQVVEQSLEAAIDEVKDELERQITAAKEKRFSKFLKAARRVKEEMRGVYRWLRRK